MSSRVWLLALAVALGMAVSASANLLLNAGFESGTGTVPDNWTTFGDNLPAREGWANRSGSYGLAFYGWNAGGGGIYQDVAAGGVSNYTFSIYAFKDNNWPARTIQMKLEFFNGSFTLLGGATNTVSGVGASWQQLSLNAQSVAGTVYVRPVLAFDAGGTDGGAFKWDDAALTSSQAIPEPAAVSLIGLGVLVLHRAWRRVR
jgi:hypothetical protein